MPLMIVECMRSTGPANSSLWMLLLRAYCARKLRAALGVLGTPPGVADDSTAAWKRAEIIVGQRVGAVVRGLFEVPVLVEGGVDRAAEFVADAGEGGVDACD
jgi:hypothetical protein